MAQAQDDARGRQVDEGRRARGEAVGRAEGLGRPLLYGTTPKFLEHFGFRSLEDLPRPDRRPQQEEAERGGEHQPEVREFLIQAPEMFRDFVADVKEMLRNG